MNAKRIFINLQALFHKFHRNIPLTLKMFLLTVFVSLLVWAVSDFIQARKLRQIYFAELQEDLSSQALEDRLRFDRHIKSFNDSVKMFVTHKNFIDYIEDQRWAESATAEIKHYNGRAPLWFPNRSVLRSFVKPRYALLLDSHGKTREVYQFSQDILPEALLRPSSLLIKKSHNQSFLTSIEGSPYLVVSESYFDSLGELRAMLLFSSPLDNMFLINSLGVYGQEHLIALLTSGKDFRILSSNNLKRLPVGSSLDDLEDRYLVTGKEFFDYGASEIQVRYATFVSREEIDLSIKSAISRARNTYALSSLTLIITFTLIMSWITRHIENLIERITLFSHEALGTEFKKSQKGDKLQILEESFQNLIDELKESTTKRDILDKELFESKKMEKVLEFISSIDGLTSIANRREFDKILDVEWRRAMRSSTPLSIIMIDIDYFKHYNDLYGHLVGDTCLQKLARTLNDSLKRAGNFIARYGGEEFAAILPNTENRDALFIAESLRKNIENLNIEHKDSMVSDNVTISLGVATTIPDMNKPFDLMDSADKALYQAKKEGRNRVIKA